MHYLKSYGIKKNICFSLGAFPEHILSKFKDVEKNALFCNTSRIIVMKDEVLEEGWKRMRFVPFDAVNRDSTRITLQNNSYFG